MEGKNVTTKVLECKVNNKKSESLEKWLFKVSIAFLLAIGIFSYGIRVGRLKLPPYETIKSIYLVTKSLVKFGKIVPKNCLMTAPDYASRENFSIQNDELMMEGYYAFLGWDDRKNRYSAWLYNHLGKQLHTWPIDYYSLDPDGPLNGSEQPHGFIVFPDGSIMVNFDRGDVMARIDSCGKTMWTKQGVYHHSLQKAEDGSIWTWRGDGSAYSQYQYLENFDPKTGETIKEIGLVEDIIHNMGAASVIFLIRPDFQFKRVEKDPINPSTDIFHPNDIDVLYSELSPMFSSFKAGDLMISLKKLNLVAVLDPDELVVKWASYGPWRWQHDPDFTLDGKISVYNNNSGLHRSEIIKIDPQTREISNDLFDGEVRFNSKHMGKHQYLPNGNILIVVPGEGRILVVSSTGQKVMEFNNISKTSVENNAHVENGLWMPLDSFNKLPECLQ
jgi:hypothetical protein